MNNQNKTEKVPEKYRPALLALMKEWQESVLANREGLKPEEAYRQHEERTHR